MEIEVKSKKLQERAGDQKNITKDLVKINAAILTSRKRLQLCLSSEASGSIDRALITVSRCLEKTADEMYGMASGLETIAHLYEITEQDISGNKPNEDAVKEAEGENVDNVYKDLSEYYSSLSKLFKEWNRNMDNPGLAIIASLLSLISSGVLLPSSNSIAEWYNNLLGFIGGGMGTAEKGGEVLEKLIRFYGSDSAKKWLSKNARLFNEDALGTLGTIGDAFSFVSDLLGNLAESDTAAEFFKKSGAIVSSGKSLIVDLKGLSKAVEFAKVNPIASIISMVLYGGGDILDVVTDGRSLSGQDMGDMLMGTGIVGANSFFEGATFGLVSIDTDAALEDFNKNISQINDLIWSMDASTETKVVIGVISSPVVMVLSSLEVIGNTIIDTVDKIDKGTAAIGKLIFGG
ncbi:MAG TPA: hypothetical protein DDY31_19410 [Lachnospiraceae bacterium]|nr:hypothetical protein [Lachnospiraceae bacterium]